MERTNILHHLLTKPTFAILLNISISILIRWCVALNQHSGQNKPPMYGDYEAQRHWQEITVNLDIKDWYRNSSSNDLQYWGLDYPPLTAYHSYLCGLVAWKVDPSYVKLHTSRGIETYHHKLFMRLTVLVSDLLIFMSSVVFGLYSSKYNGKMSLSNSFCWISLLYFPGLYLIDHGHFQYNNVSLGLFVWAVIAFRHNYNLPGAFLFCCSLNYKQMELYHALPVFFYLLGKVVRLPFKSGLFMLTNLGLTVIISFLLIWLPYLEDLSSALQVVSRIFPVDRGVFEDKVANIWCTLNPLFKFKTVLGQTALFRLCAICTIGVSIPSCLHLLLKPTFRNFKLSLFNVSLVFFLFSYHVHEKTILIPSISACMLYNTAPSELITIFLHYSVISMAPLLAKDGLLLATFATTLLYLILSYQNHELFTKHHYFNDILNKLGINGKSSVYVQKVYKALFLFAFLFSYVLLLLPYFITPPPALPDLIAVLISSVSFVMFLGVLIVFYMIQFDVIDHKSA